MSTSTPVPSPTATGGGGEHFEQHVSAFALGLLLVRATPPVLTNTVVVEVHLQTRHLGWRTDDLLLVGETSPGNRRMLAAQIKRTFTVSEAEEECRKTFQGMWDDFQASERFSSASDNLAIITLHGTSALLRSFNSLLLCGRAAKDAADFYRRLALDGYLSKQAKTQHKAVQAILEAHTGMPVDPELYWRFLRSVHIVSFDLNTPTAATKASLVSLLAQVGGDAPDRLAAATATWLQLLECVGEGKPIAASYTVANLPPELRARHLPIDSVDRNGLSAVVQHGNTVRGSIRSTIGQSFEIDCAPRGAALLDLLAQNRVVIVSGVAGSGKSALAKSALDQLELSNPVVAFHAVEFARAHIDETLANAQTTLNAQRFVALLAGHDRVFLLVESVERLLEHSVRDAFGHLLNLVSDNPAIRLVLTCRDYSLETVRNALLGPIGLSHSVLEVPTLSDEEIDQVSAGVPNLALPLQDTRLRTLLRTPYVLDMAARLDWTGSFPKNARALRDKCWNELIRADQFAAAGMPLRRERAFLDIAYRRATELRPFVAPGATDAEVLDALRQDSLIVSSPDTSTLFAPAHDVLEDWAILRWLDEKFAVSDGNLEMEMAAAVGGYPALRRGFRRWLGERFEDKPDAASDLVLRILGRADLPAYFRDDCLASALLSQTAAEFLQACEQKLGPADLAQLMVRVIHVLRVACKESPRWLNVPGLPSQLLVPAGTGWAPVLRLVSTHLDQILPQHVHLLIGLVEDWSKQADVTTPAPDGDTNAGLIVDALLTHFEGYDYGGEAARKRILEVLLKIPRAVPGLSKLLERARQIEFRDRTATAFGELALQSFTGVWLCRDFPDEVMALANARLRMTAEDAESGRASPFEVNEVFGIRERGVSDFFPASALQGPFGQLLRFHPKKAVAFIVDLLNHAADWYGTERWPEQQLEPAWQTTIEIPGVGEVQQWMNPRLYGLYRGMSVGPEVLQSALMALEAWLLGAAKMEGLDVEGWLLYILRNSNNVMATSVVASVCSANPAKAGRAGLAVLSSRDIIQCDRSRLASESSARVEFMTGLNVQHAMHEQERKTSNRLPHRGEDLETLAVRLQLTDAREKVWQTIDRYRSELPTDQDEETLTWRLALHRMDVRGFKPVDTPPVAPEAKAGGSAPGVYFGPGQIEPDVQQLVDASSASHAIIGRHLHLLNRATNAWRDRASADAGDWKTLLSEAQSIVADLDEPEDFCRGGPGLVAAVCIRDHVDELDDRDLEWCAKRIQDEILRDSDNPEETVRLARGMPRPDRAGASVVGMLVARQGSRPVGNAHNTLAVALTHPVDEVADYAHSGVGAFLGDEHRELILQCGGAAAYRARLVKALRDEEQKRPYTQRSHGREIVERAVPSVRDAIAQGTIDVSAELSALDLSDWSGAQAAGRILEMLGHHPTWEESRAVFTQAAKWLADVRSRDQSSQPASNRNFHFEQAALTAVARFVLKLPADKARSVSAPLIAAIETDPREAADFLHALISAADGGAGDCFWELWRDVAEKVCSAPWVTSLKGQHPYAAGLIHRLFLMTYWKDDIQHWERLEGHAGEVDAVALRLPAAAVCLEAYTRFLYTIGRRSLPDALKVVAALLERGDAAEMAANSEIAFFLESLLRQFVYSQPLRLKSDGALRNAVLTILDALVEAGSSAAYRMRDDFVTPLGQA